MIVSEPSGFQLFYFRICWTKYNHKNYILVNNIIIHYTKFSNWGHTLSFLQYSHRDELGLIDDTVQRVSELELNDRTIDLALRKLWETNLLYQEAEGSESEGAIM